MLHRRLSRLFGPPRKPRKTRHRLGVAGAVMIEYAFLLVAVCIPMIIGLTAGGRQLYKNYVLGRDAMLSPFP